MLPATGRLLARGLTRRCAWCGSSGLFTRWFTMVERCPNCGWRFERDEGFFLGALVINFGCTIAILGVLMAVIIGILANGGSIVAVVAIAVVETIVVPLAFYPFSKTTWSAVDLALHRGDYAGGEVTPGRG